jgi:hypothetical protein
MESVSKPEPQDTEGKWYTVWSGISPTQRDERGERTWQVRSFPAATYAVKAAKLAIANTVENGYEVIDALQLVGN